MDPVFTIQIQIHVSVPALMYIYMYAQLIITGGILIFVG